MATQVLAQRPVGAPSMGLPVAAASLDARVEFLRRVYGVFLLGILISGAGGYVGLQPPVLQFFLHSFWIPMIALIGGVFVVQAVRLRPGVNVAAFGGFTFLMGMVAAPALYVAVARTGSFNVVVQAFGLTAGIFGGLTVYTFVSKRDFSFMRGFLVMGLFGLIGVGIIGMFTGFGHVASMMYSTVAALLFSGFVLYDTSRILRTHATQEYVGAALCLFLDFFNLFLALLRLLSNRD
ncbi:MAG: Bax inhibitor-1/YccA family protein [Myxococcales bacterium]|nr:Bax inhibitor-1/YccA family protein [Myxococcales bacterium]